MDGLCKLTTQMWARTLKDDMVAKMKYWDYISLCYKYQLFNEMKQYRHMWE